MLGTGLLAFRELLKAVLIVSVICAATRGAVGRARRTVGGVAAGVLGAMLVAGSAGAIASAASGIGQEVFDALARCSTP